MNRRQFLKGLVQVASVITVSCLVPKCLPTVNKHEPQPIKIQKWRIYGATHLSLLKDGDTIWVNEGSGELMKITRVSKDTIQVERNAATWLEWEDQVKASEKIGMNSAWFYEVEDA